MEPQKDRYEPLEDNVDLEQEVIDTKPRKKLSKSAKIIILTIFIILAIASIVGFVIVYTKSKFNQ